jgi:TonB-linked SusC/RagA family outer membrane protein
MRKVGTLLLVAVLALLPVRALDAQNTGVITGSIVDQATQRPLDGAYVMVVGADRAGLSNRDGRFLIANVPAGSYDVRTSIIGYAQSTQRVTVAAGETVVVNFTLSSSAIELEGIIVSASGREERRRELGNSVASIQPADVEMAAVNTMSGLLQARAAGVSVVQSGGATGTGARVRIRGSNSVTLSNEPLLIIDGIRANNTAESFTIATGGQSFSRLNDLNPEDIESIEILKGPAAAAMYGTAAANGVIQVSTKRGRAGETRWSAYTELGRVVEYTQYQDNIAEDDWCAVVFQNEGWCQPGTLYRFNPFMDPTARPFQDGTRNKVGLNVTGGTERVTYYMSAEQDHETGIFKTNNKLDRLNFRANLAAQLLESLNVSLRTGYMVSDGSLPQNDNNFTGIHLNGNLGWADTTVNGGWYWLTPEEIFAIEAEQEVRRLTSSAQANYQPLPWLSVVGIVGLDQLSRHDEEFIEPNRNPVSANTLAGTRISNRIEVRNLTAQLSGTAQLALNRFTVSTTSLGTSYYRDEYHDTRGYGVGVVPGTRSLSGTTRQFAVSENTSDNVLVGAFVQQQFGFNDRIFLTGALRGDQNSAFGTDIGFIVYPSMSGSWVISEESFFPELDVLSSFRLRSSIGRSGLRPQFRDAAVFFTPTPTRVGGAELPGFTMGGAGNPELKPELSTEVEVGFDAGFFRDRIGLDFTYFNKQSKDALIRRRLAPSLGASPTRFENIGSVSNVGVEAMVNARVLQRPDYRWDVTATFTRVRNRLEELGEGVEPIIFGLGSTQRHVEGYPLGGYWSKPMTWTDLNNDGKVQISEVTETDDFQYMGTPFPTREVSLSSSLSLFNLVRFSGLLDYKGGHQMLNYTHMDRCSWEMVCEETYIPEKATISNQMGFVGWNYMNRNISEYIEDADYLKLREASVSLIVPSRYTAGFGLGQARVTLSGRNLGTWTKYSGYDPEVNTVGQANFTTADYHNQVPVRYYTLRVDLNF